jgi:hypothetical protein
LKDKLKFLMLIWLVFLEGNNVSMSLNSEGLVMA